MKRFSILCLLAGLGLSSSLLAQVFPLSENSWRNPEFVERFLGSYGTLTNLEPTVNQSESEALQGVVAALQQNNQNGAIAQLSSFLQQRAGNDPAPSAALDYTLGNLHLQAGNFGQAIRAYENAIRKFPNFLRAYKNLGLGHLQMQNYPSAREFLVKALELGDADGNTYGLLAYCYLNEGDPVSALEGYRVATLLKPDNKDWQLGRATSLLQTGQYEEAIANFRRLIEAEPNQSRYYSSLVNGYLGLRQPETAASIIEVVYRMGDADVRMLNLLGDIYLNMDSMPLAARSYLAALDADGSQNSERIFRTARALIARRGLEQAQDFLERAESEVDAEGEERLEFLKVEAELALAQGQNDRVVALLEEVLELDPFDAEATLLLGKQANDSGDAEQAAYYFERAAEFPEVAAAALIELARLRVAQKRYADAIDYLERSLNFDNREAVRRYLEAVRRVNDARGA